VLEIGVRGHLVPDDAIEVRPGLADLLDVGPVGGGDRMARLALLEVRLARGRIAGKRGARHGKGGKGGQEGQLGHDVLSYTGRRVACFWSYMWEGAADMQ